MHDVLQNLWLQEDLIIFRIDFGKVRADLKKYRPIELGELCGIFDEFALMVDTRRFNI